MANDWTPDLAAIAWDDTVAVANAAALHGFCRQGAVIDGATINPARNQRLRLVPSGDFSFAAFVAAGSTSGAIDLRNRNYLDGGKVLLIEPDGASPQITGIVAVSGCRGLYVRGLDLVASCTDMGKDVDTWEPLNGGPSPRDASVFSVQRNTSNPLLPVVVIDGCRFGPEFKTVPMTDPRNFPSAIACANAEQISVINCTFRGYQTGLKMTTIRRLRVANNDFRRGIGDVCIVTNTAAQTAISGGQSYEAIYPDRLVYILYEGQTGRDIIDDCTLKNAAGQDLRLDQEHTDGLQFGTSGDRGSYKALVRFNAFYLQRVTYQDRNSANPALSEPPLTVRVNGGTQGIYCDDSGAAHNIDLVAHDNICVVSTQAGLTLYNGASFGEYNTNVRVGALPPSATMTPDGFNYSTDVNSIIKVNKISGAITNHYVANNLGGDVFNLNPPRDATVTAVGNVGADPRASTAPGTGYSDIFEGAFGSGSTYSLDQTLSRAAFRAALYAQFKGKGAGLGKGSSDPATWPVAP